MPRDCIVLMNRVSETVQRGKTVDVFAFLDELKNEFPNVPRPKLARIVMEEVIIANARAVWENFNC